MIQKGEETLQRWDLKAFTRQNEGEDVSQQDVLQGTVIPVQMTPPITVKETLQMESASTVQKIRF